MSACLDALGRAAARAKEANDLFIDTARCSECTKFAVTATKHNELSVWHTKDSAVCVGFVSTSQLVNMSLYYKAQAAAGAYD